MRFEKPKTKIKGNFRDVELTCPDCMSVLTYDEDYQKICTGNMLQLWEDKFKEYETLTINDKLAFLIAKVDKVRFVYLYKKWKNAVAAKEAYVCDYSSTIVDPSPDRDTLVPDPIMLKRLERDLQRPLTQLEIDQEQSFYFNGTKYSEIPTDNSRAVKIKWIKFPYDF